MEHGSSHFIVEMYTRMCFSFVPCKKAAAGDEGYLVCAAGAAERVSSSSRFSLGVQQHAVVVQCA